MEIEEFVIFTEKLELKKPFIGNADDEVDRAAKRYVVEGEEELWEEVGVVLTVQSKRPGVNLKYFLEALINYAIATSDKCVVEYHEADEDAVENSECNKKSVERVLHLLA